jgi:hypothetical protein
MLQMVQNFISCICGFLTMFNGLGFGVALLAAHGEFLFAAILLLCSSLEICIFDGSGEFEELS